MRDLSGSLGRRSAGGGPRPAAAGDRRRARKLDARGISAAEAEQLIRNDHVTVGNPRASDDAGKRRLLIGRTDGGRYVTLVIEKTVDPTSWLIVTGWDSTPPERKIVQSR